MGPQVLVRPHLKNHNFYHLYTFICAMRGKICLYKFAVARKTAVKSRTHKMQKGELASNKN